MEFVKEWLNALRSGEYRQGKNSLRQPQPDGSYTYCCLGVLCDLYNKEGWGYPFLKHMKEIGVSEECMQHFAKMNDEGRTFNEIADEIERRYTGDTK